jgi:DNA-nicking Smr family endonuclease
VKKRRQTRDSLDKTEPILDVDTDAAHFARAMSDVVRLKSDPRGRVDPPVPRQRGRTRADVPAVQAPDDDDHGEAGFVTPGVDRRELRKLKRGDYPPGDDLDLHGLMAVDALASVKRFIDTSRSRHRCVCIVHGRGLHSEGQIAVLKARVRGYLRQHRSVLAFADAPRDHGGAGAVYVLLRKSERPT